MSETFSHVLTVFYTLTVNHPLFFFFPPISRSGPPFSPLARPAVSAFASARGVDAFTATAGCCNVFIRLLSSFFSPFVELF